MSLSSTQLGTINIAGATAANMKASLIDAGAAGLGAAGQIVGRMRLSPISRTRPPTARRSA